MNSNTSWILMNIATNTSVTDYDLYTEFCTDHVKLDNINGDKKLTYLSRYNYNRAKNWLLENKMIKLVDGEYILLKRCIVEMAKPTVNIKCFYIVEFDEGCKVGISKNFKTRITHYSSAWCKPIKTVYILKTDDPREIELYAISTGAITSNSSKEFLPQTSKEIRDIVIDRFPDNKFVRYMV